ncbi:hypothetical protein OXB_1729 [Bacillus sp. OxB-1]|uniref:TIGR02679 family protein n=1 Tax=Bacillus sp. (strain OxB-1) TaxID=98228 RepID=UPI0005820407|nr:TIGR02679 family protein [Bacillus sp. OxB-1]BAQ10200.1 hypothetical protein OXB_1729 [Bacillus sp. OxB-1]
MQDALEFFRSEPAYGKLFQAFRNKYESLGRLGGNISTDSFSEEELEQIARFFGISTTRLRRKGAVALLDFESQLRMTRFGIMDLKALLDAYFGEEIFSKREQEMARRNRIQDLLQTLQSELPALSFWFGCLLAQSAEARWIIQTAERDEALFRTMSKQLHKAILELPNSPVRLPFFSQLVTGDPHAMDLNTEFGKLFLHALAVLQRMNEDGTEGADGKLTTPTATEEVNELLNTYNIYRDDLLNFVTIANFTARMKTGETYPVWQSAGEVGAVLNSPLREIIALSDIRPATGQHVWIVENSGVCSALLDWQPRMPIISTNGQFKLAALLMMDQLVEAGFQLHYSGDFDPEGLSMAQRLLERFPGYVDLWCMDVNTYRLSKPLKKLEPERLSKLNGINHPSLIELSEAIKTEGKAGYQEAIVEGMLSYIGDVLEKGLSKKPLK